MFQEMIPRKEDDYIHRVSHRGKCAQRQARRFFSIYPKRSICLPRKRNLRKCQSSARSASKQCVSAECARLTGEAMQVDHEDTKQVNVDWVDAGATTVSGDLLNKAVDGSSHHPGTITLSEHKIKMVGHVEVQLLLAAKLCADLNEPCLEEVKARMDHGGGVAFIAVDGALGGAQGGERGKRTSRSRAHLRVRNAHGGSGVLSDGRVVSGVSAPGVDVPAGRSRVARGAGVGLRVGDAVVSVEQGKRHGGWWVWEEFDLQGMLL